MCQVLDTALTTINICPWEAILHFLELMKHVITQTEDLNVFAVVKKHMDQQHSIRTMNKSVLVLRARVQAKVHQKIISHTKLLQVHVSLKKSNLRMNILAMDIVQIGYICQNKTQKLNTQNSYPKMILFSTKIESESAVTDAELQQY